MKSLVAFLLFLSLIPLAPLDRPIKVVELNSPSFTNIRGMAWIGGRIMFLFTKDLDRKTRLRFLLHEFYHINYRSLSEPSAKKFANDIINRVYE